MSRPARPEETKSARSSHQFNRFCYPKNPDKVFGTHSTPALHSVTDCHFEETVARDPRALSCQQRKVRHKKVSKQWECHLANRAMCILLLAQTRLLPLARWNNVRRKRDLRTHQTFEPLTVQKF